MDYYFQKIKSLDSEPVSGRLHRRILRRARLRHYTRRGPFLLLLGLAIGSFIADSWHILDLTHHGLNDGIATGVRSLANSIGLGGLVPAQFHHFDLFFGLLVDILLVVGLGTRALRWGRIWERILRTIRGVAGFFWGHMKSATRGVLIRVPFLN